MLALLALMFVLASPSTAQAQSTDCTICAGDGKPKVTSLTFRFNGPDTRYILVQDKDNEETYFAGWVDSGAQFTAAGTSTDNKFHSNDLFIVVLTGVPGDLNTERDEADVDVIKVHVSCSKPLFYGMDLAEQEGREDPNTEDIGKFTLTGGLDTNSDEICQGEVDLGLVKSATGPDGDDLVSFTLTVTNYSDGDATGVVITDSIPAGLSGLNLGSAPSGTSVDYTAGILTWAVGDLNGNSSKAFSFTATQNVDSVTNCAEISAMDQDDPDSTPGNGAQDPSEDDRDCVTTSTDEAFCYLVADNDGFDSGSSDGITKIDNGFGEIALGLSGTARIEAITFVSSIETLFGSDDGRFGSINTTTGAFSYIGDFGSGDGAQGNISYDDIDGLAYDPFTQIMYASVRRTGSDDILIQVDINTGSGIDDAFGSGVDYVVVEKINDLEDVDDIAISSLDGTMYAIQNTDGDDSRLITIDKQTGATTDIGDLDVPNVEGLGFYPDGRLLGVNGDAFRSVMQIPLYPFTGVTIPVSNLGVNGWMDYEGIACLTEEENTIQGTVYVDPQYIDLMLEKDGVVTAGNTFDEIEYLVTVTNDDTNPVAGPNAPSGAGLGGITVELYRDNIVVGDYDLNDELLATTVTAPDGSYSFSVAANGNFVVRVDLNSVSGLAFIPPDNQEVVDFIGFGETLSDRDFFFYQLTDASGITVKDIFPSGASFVSATPSVGTFNDGTMTWDLGSLARGSSATLKINATTQVDGQLVNCAEIMTADQNDIDSTPGNGEESEDDYDCAPTNHDRPNIDLKLEKSADKTSAALGDEIVYTLTLSNDSAVEATDVVVTDDLPYGVAFVSSNPAATYDALSHTVTWAVASLAGGANTTLDITVIFDGFSGNMPSSMFLEDSEYVLRNHPDGNAQPPLFGLRLDKLFGNKSPVTFNFDHAQSDMRMRLEDSGATAVIFGTTWGGYDTGGSYADAGLWNVSFSFDNLLSQLSGDDDIVAQGGDAELSSGTIIPQYSTADFTSGHIYNLSDKESGGYSFRLGNRSNNLGHRGHDGISGWGWLNHDGDGALNHKPTSDFLFTAYPIPDVLGNCAQVMSAAQTDSDSTPGNAPDYGQEDDDPCFDIPREEEDPVIDLELEKTAQGPVDGEIIYTLTLTNNAANATTAATDVEVTEELPSEVTFGSVIASQGNYSNDVWSVGTLAIGGVATLEITVSVDNNTTIENCAEVTNANETDVDSTPGDGEGDDHDCVQTPPEDDPEVDIEVEKTASDLNPEIGDQITYTITVTNNGPADANNLEVTDVLPGAVSYVSDAPSAGSYDNNTGIWTLPFLAAGDSETLDITVDIQGAGDDLSDGVYRLHNHPGNDMAPPGYGLRLDELFGGFHGITFDFDHVDSEVLMTVSGSTIHITGQVYGGYDAGGAYDPATAGLWNIDFTYDSVVANVPGDDDLYVNDPDSEVSTGTIVPQYTTAFFSAGDVYDLKDKSDGSYSFRLGDKDDDLGYNNYASTSGWGWLQHGTNGNVSHTPISDWIFTATPVHGAIVNCAELTAVDENDVDSIPNDGEGDDYDCVTVTPGDPLIDLSLEKDVDQSEASVGDVIHYTITVSNDAGAGTTATNITVVDDLPDGIVAIDTNPTANITIDNVAQTVTWFIPSLAPGQSLVLDIEAQITQAGWLCNCAEIMSADQQDIDDIFGDGTGEDYDCAVTTTDDPFIDLALDKAVFPTNPGVGDMVEYVLTVTNDAGATETAFGITVVDTVPDGLTVASTDPLNNVTVNDATNIVSWFIPSLAPGEELVLSIYAHVDAPGVWENCAEVMAATGTDTDSTPGDGEGDDHDCAVTETPDPTIDLSLEKSVDDSTPTVGQGITYTLKVSNDAAATEVATGVVVEDQLPAGVTIDPGFSNPNVTVSPSGLITWNVGSVGIDDFKTLDIPVEVTLSTLQVNCAQITAADQDDMDSTPDNGTGNGEDDQDCVSITPNLIPNNAICYFVADNDDHTGSDDVLTYVSGSTEYVVGLTGTQQINAIEYVGATGKLYAVDGGLFGTLNPATGVFSAIGNVGNGLGTQGAMSFDNIDGLALDPYTGVLYATVRTGGEDLLIQISLVTGSAVQNAFGVGQTYVVIPTVDGMNDVDDIAIQLSTGTLYGVMNGGGGNSKLVTIDKATGASALAATLDVGNVRGLAFRSNGQLIGTLGSTDTQARKININNGSTSAFKTLGVDGNFDYEAVTCNTDGPNWLNGTVFMDNNEDALFDAGDAGEEGITVRLYKDKGVIGVVDGPDVYLGSVVTDFDGNYSFPILSTGTFIVDTDLSTYPAGAVLTTDNVETAQFFGTGDVDEDNDFGFKIEAVVLGSIGDIIFNDENANGIQDVGEVGIGGILVRLHAGACPAVGSPIANLVTNPSGGYTFNNLPPGTYCVDVLNSTVPNGFVHTTANDPMTVTLANGQHVDYADFGYYFNPAAAEADLELTKEVDTSSPALDDVVTFTITVRNNGPADATNLIVRDIIPVGLVFQDYSSSRGSYEANKLGFWTIGDLAVGETETLEIRTKVVITNMIENIAQVSHVDQEDPDSTPGNGVPTEDDQDNALVESRGPGSVGDIVRAECADMGTVNALIYSSYDDQIYAGTEVGSLHISNDDGVNWPTFLQTDNDAPIRDIVVNIYGDLYVGTFGDGVYVSTDSGTNWTNIGPAVADVNDLDIDDNTGNVYAAAHGKVMVYNGFTWSEVGSATNPFSGDQVLAVVFDENNNRLVASSAGSGAWKFSGGTWTEVNTGLPIGKINELFRSPNGEILAGTNSDGVYLFGGSMWLKFGMGLDSEPIESLGSGPNGELLAGARESGAYFYNAILGEWVSIGNLPIFTVASITAGPLGEVYAGAPGEGIYVIYDSDFDGIPDIAHQVANFMTSAVIQDLVVAPNGDMWAATYGYGILYSSDGGRCWTRMNRGLNNLWTFAIERKTDGTLFIGIWADGKGGIWRSTDDGRNWEFLALPTRQIISIAIDPNNENIIYAGANLAGEGALYRSMDGGDTWQSQGQFIQPIWSITIDPDDSNHILVGTLGDGIHESNDMGLTFEQIGSPTNGLDNPYVFDMSYAPFGTPYEGTLFAATDSGVYRYDEFSEAWSLFGIGSEDFQFRTLAFAGTQIYGGTWNAGVVQYDALTNEWGDYGLGDLPVIAFAVHQPTQTLVIGTSGSGVFLSVNFSISTAIEDEQIGTEIPTAFSLESNYPNPFNPQTTIPFNIKESGHVRVAVYDMLGREVGMLIDGALAAGTHQVTWEAGDRPSGTYLVRMDAGGQTFTKTMILLK